jgi:hypothetical protein
LNKQDLWRETKPGNGRLVEYIGATIEQIHWGNNDDPRGLCRLGEVYEVEWTQMHSWHTKMKLVEFKWVFNSVSFVDVYPNPWSRSGSV